MFAARVTDYQLCPLTSPAGGAPILLGCPTVMIGGMMAARMGDLCACAVPPDTIMMGSPTVLIGGQPAARMGDPTANEKIPHVGSIITGFPMVMIG